MRYPIAFSVKPGSPHHYHDADILREKVERKTPVDFIEGCPLENALNRQLPDHIQVTTHVGSHIELEVWNRNSSWSRRLTVEFARAADFLRRHRTGKTLKPFAYTLELGE